MILNPASCIAGACNGDLQHPVRPGIVDAQGWLEPETTASDRKHKKKCCCSTDAICRFLLPLLLELAQSGQHWPSAAIFLTAAVAKSSGAELPQLIANTGNRGCVGQPSSSRA